MEYIRNMDLASALYRNPNIKIQKGLFGLRKSVVYVQTNSPVRSLYMEYDSANGLKIKRLLEMSADSSSDCLFDFGDIKKAENGMFSLSVCYSLDKKFAALQLSQYVNFGYHPVGDVRVAEGKEAELLLKPFVA